MKKSLLLLMTLVIVLTMGLAGCGSKSADPPPANTQGNEGTKEAEPPKEEPEKVEPFEMTIRHTQVAESSKNRLKILQDVAKKTEEEVPGLTLKLDGVQDAVNRNEKLRGEMAAGNPPEIFDTFGRFDAYLYYKEGKMLDITPIIEELGIKDKFFDLKSWTSDDGKVYGLPVGGSAEAFFYNKEYFEQKGLKVPTTFEELEDLLAKIKADGKVPIAAASQASWVPLMMTNQLWARYAGPEITAGFASGKTKWDDPNMIKAWAKHKEWVDKGYFKKGELALDYADMTTQFTTGEAVMMFEGTWRSSIFKKAEEGQEPNMAEDMRDKVGFFNMPPLAGGPGDQTALMQDMNNGYGFSAEVAKDERKLNAVKVFIKNLYNEEMQLRGFKEDGVLPSMKVDEQKYQELATEPIMKEITGTLSKVQSSFNAFDALVQPSVRTEVETQIQKLIGGQATAEDALAAIQKAQDVAIETGQ
ncbi:ABC transporter substrate-binding protein [Paenibacillus sp. MSJ-34]|uniref:ABC transporter substrate-binding protein n=1 Tax=Paenibacillus sp. MSJ-34 TaxID=2841529 RepID=UPI001C10D15C|nr:extracellular solute-binding protein [Paenibacillus sp. MSJ-34]MBU5443065.1 extracellular solute-binding protein [Paenibacillus sp. MSJ-34]